jgi:hypothetical protein
LQTQLSEIQQIVPELMSKSKFQIHKLESAIEMQCQTLQEKEQSLTEEITQLRQQNEQLQVATRSRLQATITEKYSNEDKMSKQIDSLRQLHSHAMEELCNRDRRITLPEKELLELREKILDDSMDDVLIVDQTGQLKKQLIKERDMLLVKIETLSEEIKSLRGALESKLLSELKSKLAHSEQVREELEKDRLHHSQQG